MGSIAVSQDSLPYAGPKAAKQKAVKSVGKHGVDIIDVRRVAVETNLKDDILSMWNPTNGPRRLPTLLLYNERGLQLFEDVRAFRPLIGSATSCVIGTNNSYRSHTSKNITSPTMRLKF